MWWCAEQVYPGRTFRKYAVLVIADAKVAQVYEDRQESRSRKTKIGSREFAGEGSDFSPISVKAKYSLPLWFM